MSSGTDRQSLGQSRESLKNTSIFSTDHKTLSVFSSNNDKKSVHEKEEIQKCTSGDDLKIARYRRKLFKDSILYEESLDEGTAKSFQPVPQEETIEQSDPEEKNATEPIASHKKPYRSQHFKSKYEDDRTIDAEVSTSTSLLRRPSA